jgi:hypothetical protein
MLIQSHVQFSFGQRPVTSQNARGAECTGMLPGTRVESGQGWIPVDILRAGDSLYTYDGGLRRVAEVVWSDPLQDLTELVSIAGGTLGNTDDLWVLPAQKLLVDLPHLASDGGAVLVRAGDLVGLTGVTRQATSGKIPVANIRFDEEEIVWANDGLLFHCGPETGFFAQATPQQLAQVNQRIETGACDLQMAA